MPVAQPVYNALFDEIKTLPEDYAIDIFNFIGYLKAKAANRGYSPGECPICSNSTPNAETIAAIQEGRAMMRGEIPTKWYNSLDEMLEDLDADDYKESLWN